MSFPLHPCGEVDSDTTQAIADVSVGQALSFDIERLRNQIELAPIDDTKLVFKVKGIYYMSYSLNVELTSGSNKTFWTWLRVNGVDVLDSCIPAVFVSQLRKRVVATAFLGELQANDYVQIMIGGDSTDLRVLAEAAAVTPTRPATPSARALAFRASEIFPL